MFSNGVSTGELFYYGLIFAIVNTAVAYLLDIKKWKIYGPLSGIGFYVGTFILLIMAAVNKFRAEQAKKAVASKENSTQQ